MPYIGTSPSNGVRRVFDYTATAGQTSFSGSDNNSQTLAYTDSTYIDVYQNGILLIPSDYTATTGTSVVLDTGATVSDTVQIVVYDVFSVADTVSKANGGTFESNISIGGTLGVTGNVISPVTIGGTTPTLTIGDAGAEDTKIVFDGNAQDFHIGLDDSADSLTIGLGSTLGTTSHMVFDANGHITKPLQSAFLATPSSQQSDFATGSAITVAFGTEIYDQNGDFASNTFTAPVTGKYFLGVNGYIRNLDTAANYYQINLETSNRNYYDLVDPNFSSDMDYYPIMIAVVVDMDANDTAVVEYTQSGGSAQSDINTDARFMGYLLG
tara:strand:+ start:930 stop:1904 length:975 start_codon:yes stop_codon:yes gene_type:complete